MSKRTQSKEDLQGVTVASAELAAFLQAVDAEATNAAGRLVEMAQNQGNLEATKAQGFYFEERHTQIFNLDAKLNRLDAHAIRLKANGLKSVDIEVRAGDQVVETISAKSYQSGKDSAIAQKGYGDQTRLIPEGQTDSANAYIERAVAKDSVLGPNRQASASDLLEVKEKLAEKVDRREGSRTAESDPISRQDVEKEFRRAQGGEKPDIKPGYDSDVFTREVARATATAVGVSVSITLANEISNALWERHKNGELPRDVFLKIGKKTVASGLTAGVTTAFSSSIVMAAKSGKLGPNMLGASASTVGAVVYLAKEAALDFAKVRKGAISPEWFADGLLQKSTAAYAGAVGATIGQVVIPIPILGAMIGSAIGSLIASNGYRLVEAGAEAHFGEEELRQLENATNALYFAWSDFEETYNDWNLISAWYNERMVSLRQGHAGELEEARNNLIRELETPDEDQWT